MFTKLRVGLTGLAATAVVGALSVLPAQADPAGVIVADGVGFIETVTVQDAGGIPYTISLDWNYKYKDAAGTTRVSVNPLVIKRSDSAVLDHGQPEDAGLDLHFDVSSHGTVRWTQHVLLDNVNLDEGADNQASFNPRNPISDPLDTFVRVKVGTDGDGLGSSRWVVFYQPEGIGTKPAI